MFLFFVTPEGFTTLVANEALEKARAYLNQVPRDQQLYIPSEGCGVNFRWKHLQTTPTHFLWAELSRLLGEKIPVAIVGLEPWTPGSVVQCFNHLATKQPLHATQKEVVPLLVVQYMYLYANFHKATLCLQNRL